MNFPWTESQFQTLLKKFDGEESFSVKWPWATYHEVGVRALKYASKQKGFPLNEVLENLSCAAPPQNLEKLFFDLKLLDENGRITALDPKISILETLALSQNQIDAFSDNTLTLPRISRLLDEKPEILKNWTPVFSDEITILEEWLSKREAYLKSFQESSAWEQLRLVEVFVGVSKSWTLLNFQRIYSLPTKW